MLRQALSHSGGDVALKNALEKGVVYGGDSAGSIVIGPTLKYFNEADDPTVVENAIYKGLNFVDFAVLPHWDSTEYSRAMEKIELSLKKDGYKTIRLTDEEFLFVENGSVVSL